MVVDFKRQLWMTLTVILGVFVLFGPAFFWVRRQIDFQVSDIVRQRELIRQESTLTGTLADLKREKQTVEIYQQNLERLVVGRDQLIVGFSEWLEREARFYDVGTSFNFQGSEVLPAGDSFGQAEFGVRLTGSVSSLVGLFRRLEQESRQFLINFNDFDVSQGPQGYVLAAGGRVYFR